MRTSRFLIGCGLLLLAAGVQAQHPDIIVSKTSDSFDGVCDSDCSLREAITLASQRQGSQRIRLGAGVYQLSLAPPQDISGNALEEDDNHNGDLDVRTAQISLIGTGTSRTFIDGAQLDRLIDIAWDAQLQLRDLSLRNGLHPVEGGAIRNRGKVELKNVRLLNNQVRHADPLGRGGALLNQGEARIHDSEFIRSHVIASPESKYPARSEGGAIFNTGQLLIRDSALRGSQAAGSRAETSGGALHNEGFADINRSLFLANGSAGIGGAVTNLGEGLLVMANTTLSGNMAPEAVFNNGYGYPINKNGPRAYLVHVTIAGNGTTGLHNFAHVRLRNSLILGNSNMRNCINQGGALLEAEGLLLGSEIPSGCVADITVDNASAFSMVLRPINPNEPGLQTHALRPGSVAVDAASAGCASFDQRGVARPRDGDSDGVARCDLGAYEL